MTSYKHVALYFVYSCVGIMAQIMPPTLDFSGIRRPGTTCTFNPCTIPNFCGEGRSCEIDEHCVSRCECTTRSMHPECIINNRNEVSPRGDKEATSVQRQFSDTEAGSTDIINAAVNGTNPPISISPTQRTDISQSLTSQRKGPADQTDPDKPDCRVDPCTTMSWLCDGGRQCVNRACILHCECTTASTHSSCLNERKDPLTSSSPADTTDAADGDCGGFAGLKCQHGSCVQIGGALSCRCEENWKGALCDQHSSTGCVRRCEEGYECRWYMDTMQICVPIQKTPGTGQDSNSNREEAKDELPEYNACLGGYKLHPLSMRMCFPGGVPCLYGVCESDADVTRVGPGLTVCRCDPGAFGLSCNETCCRDCGMGGECFVDADGSEGESCRCLGNYTGINCTELISRETDNEWYLWVVGTCSGMLLVLLVLVVIVPYVMWKHRVILVMRIVHYFQGYEDDDDREWDAFISYKSAPADEAFVTKVLYQKLEEEYGFKLNVHFRDFIPGNTIANNIIRAVKGSRRTILVVTAQYIKSEYTKLEYQVAQQQMLEHKHRIIPILLEDISDCEQFMDPNLKFILRSVTYLEWPRDNSPKRLNKFWKRLHLSMPKKRNPNVRNIIPQRPDVLENNIPNRADLKMAGRTVQNGRREIVIPRIHIENEEDHYHTIDDIMRL